VAMRAAVLGGLLLALATCAHASAQSSMRPSLHWVRDAGAEGCIDPRSLALRVAELSGRVWVEPASADVSIEGLVRATGPGVYDVVLHASDATGTPQGVRRMTLREDNCRALDRTIAFMVAMLIDPQLALSELPAHVVALGVEDRAGQLLDELESAPPAPAMPALPATVPLTARPTPAQDAAPTRDDGPGFALRAGLSVSGHDLQRPSLGGALGAEYAPRGAWVLALDARAQRMLGSVALDGARSVRALQLGASLSLCRRSTGAQLRLEACAGPALTTTRASGVGFSRDHTVYLTSYGTDLALGASLRVLGPWSVFARAGLRVAVNRPRFIYVRTDQTREALRVERIAPYGVLGAALHF
jgi:hypothetical protein